MPNILDIPMKKTQSLSISNTVAQVEFTARKAKILLRSELNKEFKLTHGSNLSKHLLQR